MNKRAAISSFLCAAILLGLASCTKPEAPDSSGTESSGTGASSSEESSVVSTDPAALPNGTEDSSKTGGSSSRVTTTKTGKGSTTTTTTTAGRPTTTTSKRTEPEDTKYYGVAGTDFVKLADKALLHVGNTSRFTKLFKKAASGQKIVVGAIGGSVTWGNDRTLEGQYIERVGKWMRDTFPCQVDVINAGIGATTSFFGVHRVDEDLLKHKPDLVVVEYAVNDADTNLDKNAYEMLVRHILSSSTSPAVMILCTMAEGGKNVQEYHVETGKHYKLPVVSYRDAVWPEMAAGRIKWSDLSPDTVHPNNKGQEILGLFLTETLQKIYKKSVTMDESAYAVPSATWYQTKFKETPIAFKNARIIPADQLTARTTGDAKLVSFDGRKVWQLKKGGKVDLALTGVSNVAIRYVLWNTGTMGWGEISVNGGKNTIYGTNSKQVQFDGYFKGYLQENGTYNPKMLAAGLNAKATNLVNVTYLDLDGFYDPGTTGERFMFSDLLVSE